MDDFTEIYLIRHGIAADRADYERDADRPLTDRGRQRTEQVARRLVDIGVRCDRLLSSPLTRALQTAAILQAADLAATVEVHPALAPGGAIADWLDWWRAERPGRVALVGHQPDLGHWTEQFVWGVAGDRIPLKKAGLACARVPREADDPRGSGELSTLVGPKWLLP